MARRRFSMWWVWASLAAAALPSEGALPNATLGVLRELWEQTGGHQWSRCQWTPDLDPCAPPWGQPHWSPPNFDQYTDVAWGLNICFVCNTTVTPNILLALDLGSNNLVGTIPDAIGQLTSLWFLGLGLNQLNGTIPETLSNLTALKSLWLNYNHLTGSIPESFGNLIELTKLEVYNNQLTGMIPESIGDLTALTELGLFSNQLTGAIPESFGKLTAMSSLALSNNQLTAIPDSLGNLTAMTLLGLSLNLLTGTIPASLGNLTGLTSLNLNNNRLTGPIPEAINKLTALGNLALSHNELSGTIPELGNLKALTFLGLNYNQLTGEVPESIGNLTALTQLALDFNHLTGPIPESLGNLTALTGLRLSNNQLNGSIPESIGNLTALTMLAVGNNQLSGPIPVTLGNLTALYFLGLGFNQLSGAIPESIGNLTALEALALYSNRLSGAIPDSLGSLTGLTQLALNINRLTGTIPESLGNLTALEELSISYNQLTGAIPESFGNLTTLRELFLTNNQITGTIPDSFRNLRQLVILGLQNNNLSDALLEPPPILLAFQGQLSVNMSGNNIATVGPMFSNCTSRSGDLTIDLSNNSIGNSFLESSLASATRCASSLTLDLSYNNITSVQFSHVASYTLRYCELYPCPHIQIMDVSVDVSHNPIEHFTAEHLQVQDTSDNSPFRVASSTDSITLDLSQSTRTFVTQTSLYNFTGIPWNPATNGTLSLNLAGNPGVPASIVRALSNASNMPSILNVNLSWNNYTALASGTFAGSRAASIDLSHNQITAAADDAFDFNVHIKQLDLSWNLLTVISIPFLNNLPALGIGLTIDHNALVALPATNNHVADDSSVGFNRVQCDSYGPTASGCVCSGGYHVSRFSGYIRCTRTPNGCPEGTVWNGDDESNAPWSSCVNGSLRGQYFFNNTFLPITECSTYLASTGKQAYEVQPPELNAHGTATSDRLCSLCSTCPKGYSATPCTAKSDTKCTQRLSPSDIAAIVLSIILLLIVGMLGAGYGRTQKKQRHQTQTELELTERLLGDVQDEKERAIEEIADMEHAWAIAENDLGFGAVIGEGAYGRVFRGTWGHIPVAIKVLRHPLDEMDPMMRVDFDREVKFMRSIRHPHILIFYGAGVDTESRAFLVTELMAGSLKTVLLNHETPLSWNTRMTFAIDIASGMAYLHDRGTVHRDLKADNCFLSDDNRVKVADFGTGRIAKQFQESLTSDTSTTTFPTAAATRSETTDVGRTLSSGVGSLLWMAPEALRGSRLKDGQGPALDVYSFAIVLWEIWTRARPWDEVQEEGIEFSVRLTELVNAEVRPQLPGDCEEAPDGYQALMEKCWSGRPDCRPPFSTILELLASIRKKNLYE